MEYTLEELISKLEKSTEVGVDITDPKYIAGVWKANYENQTSPKLITEFITLDQTHYSMKDFDDEITKRLKTTIAGIMSKYGTAIIEGSLEVSVELESGVCILVQMKYDEYTYLQNQVENEEYQQYLALKEKYKDWN